MLGGFLVEKVHWRWIFLVNLPLGIAGIIFSAIFLKEHREPDAGPFDLPGFLLAGIGLASLLFGLSEGPVKGWESSVVVGTVLLGMAALVSLVIVERHTELPMLDLKLFADRSFRTPSIVTFAATGALLGILFLLPQFLQGPRGLSPLQSGLTTFPQALGVMGMARLVGAKLYHVVGPRRLVVVGMVANAVITAMFLLVDQDTGQWPIRFLMLGRGMAMGMVFIPLQAAAFARVRLSDTGRASSLFQVDRQVGGAVGVALVATVLATRLQHLLPEGASPASDPAAYTSAFHSAVIASVALMSLGAIERADAARRRRRAHDAPSGPARPGPGAGALARRRGRGPGPVPSGHERRGARRRAARRRARRAGAPPPLVGGVHHRAAPHRPDGSGGPRGAPGAVPRSRPVGPSRSRTAARTATCRCRSGAARAAS